MLKTLRIIFPMVFGLAVLAGCAGDDGAIGPTGPQGTQGDQGDKGDPGDQGVPGTDAVAKVGQFTGTITGFRRDGTPLEEDFNFEYTFGDEFVIQDGDFAGVLVLQRFSTVANAITAQMTYDPEDPYAKPVDDNGHMKILFEDAVDGAEPFAYDVNFNFSKELSSSVLFKLKAQSFADKFDYYIYLPISVEENGKYNFDFFEGVLDYIERDLDKNGESDVYAISAKRGAYIAMYDLGTGELAQIEVNGESFTSGAIFDRYNDLKFFDDGIDIYFTDIADNTLAELVETVNGDQILIENYDQTDGVISFDFTINISKYRGVLGEYLFTGYKPHGLNTTAHDLTIAGSFTSGNPVYTEVAGRVRSN